VLGEMELLGGSSARRAASVVALTPVRAAAVPYAAAKDFLNKNPLVRDA
jgi:CRP-like cAMP-binding protein